MLKRILIYSTLLLISAPSHLRPTAKMMLPAPANPPRSSARSWLRPTMVSPRTC